MTSNVSISGWIHGAKDGDSAALQALWEAYYPQLVRLARQRLRDRRVSDEEDIAISVLESFFRAAQEGRFPNLDDRHDLWRLLLRMTVRKSVDQYRHANRQVRGGGEVRGESVLNGSADLGGFHAIVGDAPSPEMAAIMTEEMSRLLDLLGDEELAQIAIAKLEGYSNAEIAQRLDWAERTIDRRLDMIKRKWSRDDAGDTAG